jgi:hypothetical protein
MTSAIEEFERIDRDRFRAEVASRHAPAVMRGVVTQWPAVQAARAARGGIAAYLRPLDNGTRQMALRMPPSAGGRIFYNPDLDGFNYTKEERTLGELLERLARYASHERPPAIVVQSALLSACAPRFAADNPNPLLDASIAGRIWIGNRVITPAHFDESSNIACVVAGRRRFTLFPPEAIGDLYIGPIGYAPTGTPISLVDFDRPDARRFPRFARAMQAAQIADLEAGDAIYIPPLWWHHVRSLDAVNVLVNYWWKDRASTAGTDSALNALMLALLDLRTLPAEQRRAWGEIFRHYVFEAGPDTAAHIPEAKRGVLGEMSPDFARQVRAFLAGKLRD